MKKGSSSSSSSSSSLLFSLSCGCRDAKSASVSHVSSETPHRRRRKRLSEARKLDSTPTPTPTSSSSYPYYSFDEEVMTITKNPPSSPTFSDLLRQLGELERSVMEWGRPQKEWSRVEDSVAVVRETADPLGDFRRSMLQMIVENEIVGGEELRELLRRFLELNNPLYHDLILRAFADIWADVFDRLEGTPDLLPAAAGERTVW